VRDRPGKGLCLDPDIQSVEGSGPFGFNEKIAKTEKSSRTTESGEMEISFASLI